MMLVLAHVYTLPMDKGLFGWAVQSAAAGVWLIRVGRWWRQAWFDRYRMHAQVDEVLGILDRSRQPVIGPAQSRRDQGAWDFGYTTQAALFDYLPARQVVELAWSFNFLWRNHPQHQPAYFARLGHASLSCPEIFTRTRGKSAHLRRGCV